MAFSGNSTGGSIAGEYENVDQEMNAGYIHIWGDLIQFTSLTPGLYLGLNASGVLTSLPGGGGGSSYWQLSIGSSTDITYMTGINSATLVAGQAFNITGGANVNIRTGSSVVVDNTSTISLQGSTANAFQYTLASYVTSSNYLFEYDSSPPSPKNYGINIIEPVGTHHPVFSIIDNTATVAYVVNPATTSITAAYTMAINTNSTTAFTVSNNTVSQTIITADTVGYNLNIGANVTNIMPAVDGQCFNINNSANTRTVFNVNTSLQQVTCAGARFANSTIFQVTNSFESNQAIFWVGPQNGVYTYNNVLDDGVGNVTIEPTSDGANFVVHNWHTTLSMLFAGTVSGQTVFSITDSTNTSGIFYNESISQVLLNPNTTLIQPLNAGQAFIINDTTPTNQYIVDTSLQTITIPNYTTNMGTGLSPASILLGIYAQLNQTNAITIWNNSDSLLPTANGIMGIDSSGGGYLALYDTSGYLNIQVSSNSVLTQGAGSAQFQVQDASSVAYFTCNSTSDTVTTKKNTLDDGSGNMTVAQSITVMPNQNDTVAPTAISTFSTQIFSSITTATGTTDGEYMYTFDNTTNASFLVIRAFQITNMANNYSYTTSIAHTVGVVFMEVVGKYLFIQYDTVYTYHIFDISNIANIGFDLISTSLGNTVVSTYRGLYATYRESTNTMLVLVPHSTGSSIMYTIQLTGTPGSPAISASLGTFTSQGLGILETAAYANVSGTTGAGIYIYDLFVPPGFADLHVTIYDNYGPTFVGNYTYSSFINPPTSILCKVYNNILYVAAMTSTAAQIVSFTLSGSSPYITYNNSITFSLGAMSFNNSTRFYVLSNCYIISSSTQFVMYSITSGDPGTNIAGTVLAVASNYYALAKPLTPFIASYPLFLSTPELTTNLLEDNSLVLTVTDISYANPSLLIQPNYVERLIFYSDVTTTGGTNYNSPYTNYNAYSMAIDSEDPKTLTIRSLSTNKMLRFYGINANYIASFVNIVPETGANIGIGTSAAKWQTLYTTSITDSGTAVTVQPTVNIATAFVVKTSGGTAILTVNTSASSVSTSNNTLDDGSGNVIVKGYIANSTSATAGSLTIWGNSSTGTGALTLQGGNNSTASSNTITIKAGGSNGGTTSIYGGLNTAASAGNNLTYIYGGTSGGGTVNIYGGQNTTTPADNVVNIGNTSYPGVTTIWGNTTVNGTLSATSISGTIVFSGLTTGAIMYANSTTSIASSPSLTQAATTGYITIQAQSSDGQAFTVKNVAGSSTKFLVNTSSGAVQTLNNTLDDGSGNVIVAGYIANSNSATAGSLTIWGNSSTGTGALTLQGGNNATATSNTITIKAGGSNGGTLTSYGGASSTQANNVNNIYGGLAQPGNITITGSSSGTNAGSVSIFGGASSTLANNSIIISGATGASSTTPGQLILSGSSTTAGVLNTSAGSITIQGGNTTTTPTTSNILYLSGGGTNGGTTTIYGGQSATASNNIVNLHVSGTPGAVNSYGTFTFTAGSSAASVFVINNTTPAAIFSANSSTNAITTIKNTLDDGSGNIIAYGYITNSNSSTAGTLSIYGNSSTGNGTVGIFGGATSTLANNTVVIAGGYGISTSATTPGQLFLSGSSTTSGGLTYSTGSVTIQGGNGAGSTITIAGAGTQSGASGTTTIYGGASAALSSNYLYLYGSSGGPGYVSIYGSSAGSHTGTVTIQGGNTTTAANNTTTIYGGGSNGGTTSIYGGINTTASAANNLTYIYGGTSGGGTVNIYGGQNTSTPADNIVNIGNASYPGVTTIYGNTTVNGTLSATSISGTITFSGLTVGAIMFANTTTSILSSVSLTEAATNGYITLQPPATYDGQVLTVNNTSAAAIFTVNTSTPSVQIGTPGGSNTSSSIFKIASTNAGTPFVAVSNVSATSSVIITPPTNNSGVFQVNNSSGATIFAVDTATPSVTIQSSTGNSSNAFKVSNLSAATIFNVNTSTKAVTTVNNTLDDGAGNMTLGYSGTNTITSTTNLLDINSTGININANTGNASINGTGVNIDANAGNFLINTATTDTGPVTIGNNTIYTAGTATLSASSTFITAINYKNYMYYCENASSSTTNIYYATIANATNLISGTLVATGPAGGTSGSYMPVMQIDPVNNFLFVSFSGYGNLYLINSGTGAITYSAHESIGSAVQTNGIAQYVASAAIASTTAGTSLWFWCIASSTNLHYTKASAGSYVTQTPLALVNDGIAIYSTPYAATPAAYVICASSTLVSIYNTATPTLNTSYATLPSANILCGIPVTIGSTTTVYLLDSTAGVIYYYTDPGPTSGPAAYASYNFYNALALYPVYGFAFTVNGNNYLAIYASTSTVSGVTVAVTIASMIIFDVNIPSLPPAYLTTISTPQIILATGGGVTNNFMIGSTGVFNNNNTYTAENTISLNTITSQITNVASTITNVTSSVVNVGTSSAASTLNVYGSGICRSLQSILTSISASVAFFPFDALYPNTTLSSNFNLTSVQVNFNRVIPVTNTVSLSCAFATSAGAVSGLTYIYNNFYSTTAVSTITVINSTSATSLPLTDGAILSHSTTVAGLNGYLNISWVINSISGQPEQANIKGQIMYYDTSSNYDTLTINCSVYGSTATLASATGMVLTLSSGGFEAANINVITEK